METPDKPRRRAMLISRRCSKCAAEIIWVQLKRKDGQFSPHPLDAKPEKKRIVRFGIDGEYASHTATWVSHFATCPEADHFRKGKQ